MGKTIRKVRLDFAETLKEERPSKVLFVITTDGMENASTKYTKRDIRKMVIETTEKYNWEFIFMGANIDAFTEAEKLGIRKERAVKFVSDKEGTKKNYDSISRVMTSYRSFGVIEEDWKKKVKKGK